jgi:hypothetical protein
MCRTLGTSHGPDGLENEVLALNHAIDHEYELCRRELEYRTVDHLLENPETSREILRRLISTRQDWELRQLLDGESPEWARPLDEVRAAERAEMDAAREHLTASAPACWGWEIPDRDSVRARLLRNGYPEKLAEQQVTTYWEGRRFDEFHQGRCAICGQRPARLVTDHDHTSGLVRGYLCRGCNLSEGRSNLPIMVNYRRRNPATILGFRDVYWGDFTGFAEPEPAHDLWTDNPTAGLL